MKKIIGMFGACSLVAAYSAQPVLAEKQVFSPPKEKYFKSEVPTFAENSSMPVRVSFMYASYKNVSSVVTIDGIKAKKDEFRLSTCPGLELV